MLQQILQQMYVEPELLEKLSDDDRRHLFGKMREEQVRRWNAWQANDVVDGTNGQTNRPRLPPKPKAKKVQFMLGSDGNPWTWVIDDLTDNQKSTSLSSLLSDERTSKNHENPDDQLTDGELKMSSPVPCQLLKCHTKDQEDVVRGNVLVSPNQIGQQSNTNGTVIRGPDQTKFEIDVDESEDREVRATLSRARLLARILEQNTVDKEMTSWLKRRQERINTRQVLRSVSPTRFTNPEVSDRRNQSASPPTRDFKQGRPSSVQTISTTTATSTSTNIESTRRNLEQTHLSNFDGFGIVESSELIRRSKAALNADKNKRNNLAIRPSIRTPRSMTLPITRTGNRPLKPPSREAIYEWFRSDERPRGTGWDAEHHCIQPWFHGMVSRQEAEDMLANQPKGTFLVRFCERIWGYAVSYRGAEKCKHYLIDASNDHYQFLGEGFKKFKKFADLVTFYQSRSFVPNDRDCLTRSCPKMNNTDRTLSDLFS